METIIYPRSPREMMSGWTYLPRFVDKIRLHSAGKLDPQYQENFTKGFDGHWLKTAGVDAATFVKFVESTVTDGQVADWIAKNVKKTDAERAAFNHYILNRGRNDEASGRLAIRKEESKLTHRTEIDCFVDYIDADEHRI